MNRILCDLCTPAVGPDVDRLVAGPRLRPGGVAARADVSKSEDHRGVVFGTGAHRFIALRRSMA